MVTVSILGPTPQENPGQDSSSIGEKMNDLLVSERQQHNGMSWSKDGSVALASITALKVNQEYSNWFEKGELDFKLAEAA